MSARGTLTVEDILREREKTHGDFNDVSSVYCRIKNALDCGMHREVNPRFEAALDMIAMKMARIVCGNPTHVDSWKDIAGYATLVAKSLEEK